MTSVEANFESVRWVPVGHFDSRIFSRLWKRWAAAWRNKVSVTISDAWPSTAGRSKINIQKHDMYSSPSHHLWPGDSLEMWTMVLALSFSLCKPIPDALVSICIRSTISRINWQVNNFLILGTFLMYFQRKFYILLHNYINRIIEAKKVLPVFRAAARHRPVCPQIPT